MSDRLQSPKPGIAASTSKREARGAGVAGPRLANNARLLRLEGQRQLLNASPRVTQLKEQARQLASRGEASPAPLRSRASGLPAPLQAGVESLSGMAMDHVRVHHDSSEPARLGALAFTRGDDIHVGPGQQRHLPHEAWHVVQQAQGRVRPTTRLEGGDRINDEPGLEAEAEAMGARAARQPAARTADGGSEAPPAAAAATSAILQRVIPGLEDMVAPDEIPENWVDCFIADIGAPETHLYQEDLVAWLDAHVPGWSKAATLQLESDHWDVTLGESIQVRTLADGSCGAYAVHAIQNRAGIGASTDRYGAPPDFVAAVRNWVRERVAGDRAEVRRRILTQIRERDLLLLTGFGPLLQEAIETYVLRAQQERRGAADRAETTATTNIIDEGQDEGPESSRHETISNNEDSNPSKQEEESSGGRGSQEAFLEKAKALMLEEGANPKESPRYGAIRALGNVLDQVEFCVEYRGAYSAVWEDERSEDLLNRANSFIKSLKKYIMTLLGDDDDALTPKEAMNVVNYIEQFRKFRAQLQAMQANLSRVSAESGGGDDQVRMLNARAGGHQIVNRNFKIPARLAAKLYPLVKGYMPAWDKAATDGMKGMKLEDFRTIEALRQEIAGVIMADDTLSMDVVAAFADQLSRLASQSCSSRDVQNFEGWFNSHR